MKRAAGQLGILSTMAFAIALYVSCAECGRSASAPETISSEHPYLFVDGSTFKNLSENDEPTVVMLREHILATADSALEKGVIPVPKSGPNMGYMRAVQGQVLHLSAAYRMSGKREYFDAVRRQVDLLDTLSDWGTDHFLDIGEAALAVGIAYDWLYDEWTPEDRSEMEEAIVGCAFAPSYEVGEEEGSWMRGDFNWTQVCHGGLAVAALAIYNSCPEEARAIVERAAECVPNAAQVYYPDGAYPEGASYWEYGTTFQILLIEAMRTSIGHSFGLDEYEGFMESADFKIGRAHV